MNKDEYLEKLSTYIRKEIPADEYNNVMEYYSEYFADGIHYFFLPLLLIIQKLKLLVN